MKAFTAFNIIAQPIIFMVFVLLFNTDFTTIASAFFFLFFILQITHFLYRISATHRTTITLSTSQYIMKYYLIAIFILLLLGIFHSGFLGAVVVLLLCTSQISAINNYNIVLQNNSTFTNNMKTFRIIDFGIQSFLILYILYILLFRFTINWDFILAFIGLGMLAFWQIISFFIFIKNRFTLHRKIYLFGIALLIICTIFFRENSTDVVKKSITIATAILCLYYYAITIFELFFIKSNQVTECN